jgi:hypothetical protein
MMTPFADIAVYPLDEDIFGDYRQILLTATAFEREWQAASGDNFDTAEFDGPSMSFPMAPREIS